MKNRQLNAPQRLVVALLYIATLTSVIRYFSGNWEFLQGSSPFGLIFVSAALLLVFGTYLTEPYFTKPADTITNSTAIILALISVKDKDNFVAYGYLMTLAIVFLIFGVITVIFNNDPRPKWQRAIYIVVTKLGSSKIVFSVMYLLTLVSFFTKNAAEFWVLLSFLIILLTKFVFEDAVLWVFNYFEKLSQKDLTIDLLGEAIGKENPFLFKVEVDTTKRSVKGTRRGQLVYLKSGGQTGFLGVIANERSLLNSRWLTVYLLQESGRAINYNFSDKTITHSENIYSPNNLVYSLELDLLPDEIKEIIKDDKIYKNSARIIGYVSQGSDISKVKFETLSDFTADRRVLNEGTILEINIDGKSCLYQVIDAQTIEENLEKHNSTGFTVGIAQKLGGYDDDSRSLDVIKWLPDMYSPVYFCDSENKPSIGAASIGILPGTGLEIDIKDVNSLITHNTAILGILGIGKSVLTFELIQKVMALTNSKIICIDITGEYADSDNGLPRYVESKLIDSDIEALNAALAASPPAIQDSKKDGGQMPVLIESVTKDLDEFMKSEKRIRILNPEEILASKQKDDAKNRMKDGKWEMYAPFDQLTTAEITKIISEAALTVCRATGISKEAKLLLIFEEAHSLIPEWNSTANDSDRTAVNGTAKVILQGRKYGLGSFSVTQRTANISKSILNQCNTIFALRVFDDTGKQFLENYVGSDYSNALPTLEERHSVVVGKALKLKQPVIIKLNNKEDIVLKTKQSKK